MTHRRVLQLAAMVLAVLAGGTAAWLGHVRAVTATLAAQAASAQALLDAAPDPRRALAALRRADVRIVVGPPGAPPRGLPGGAPPVPGRRRPPWFARMIADLAHIRPRVVASARMTVVLLPAAPALARWFSADALLCALLIAVAAVGAWRGHRADVAATARLLEERSAAATELKRFLADAGHELRTPLTILSGYVDILEHYTTDARQLHVLAGMREASSRMRGLVEKLLLLSRLESLTPTSAVVSVAAVTDDVIDAMRAQFPQREIVADYCSSACVSINADDLYEAERNLVENALRYAPESPVRISVCRRDDRVEIAVADRGEGIPPAEQELVFQRFYRGRGRTGPEGSGLGLAIVRRVAERWKGTARLQSSHDGTQVILTFPSAGSDA